MAIVNRRFTYASTIKVSREDLELARTGKKTCTIRIGTVDVAQPVIRLSDGSRSLTVTVFRVDSMRTFAELTDDDARGDGLPSKEALAVDLAKYYGEIDPRQPVSVLWFRVDDGSDEIATR